MVFFHTILLQDAVENGTIIPAQCFGCLKVCGKVASDPGKLMLNKYDPYGAPLKSSRSGEPLFFSSLNGFDVEMGWDS